MNNLLFVAPDSVGIVKVIHDGFKSYTNYQVDFFNIEDCKDKFKYRNFLHRAANFFSKLILKKNLKKVHYQKLVSGRISKLSEKYETIIIIRPDFLSDTNLLLLREKANYFVAYYWDTVAFFSRKLDIRHFFDKIFSFDSHDCEKYGFVFLPNFYFFENSPGEIKYEVYNLSSYDKRKFLLEKVAQRLEELRVSYKIRCRSGKPVNSKYIERFENIIDYREMLGEVAFCNVLLEIQTSNQNGLTFRPFEALGLNKKLITNSKVIRDYDFYDENNILIIDETNISIPKQFFETPYKKIPDTVKQKYHLKNWVTAILTKTH
ncbi:MAG: hypothetical protein IPJ81_15125 [Chitinophagaceae bacterium]|nr:hypothetical protein [Chitinophagaceae bacterium]